MMPNQNSHTPRRSTIRLQNWDYRWDAPYFVTICTKDRAHYFGEITDGKMELSPAGIIADILWHEIKNHAKNVELDAFVVMPNHVHGIVILNGNRENGAGTAGNGGIVGTVDNGGIVVDDDDVDDVGTRHALSLHLPSLPSLPSSQRSPQKQPPTPQLRPPDAQTIGQQRFQNQGKNSLSSIIGSYKSAVTKHANRLGYPNGWQSRFHDHIIRDEQSFERIQQYILSNPENWQDDKFYL